MRSLRVVVLDPRPSDIVELTAAEAHEMVQAFPFQRADERLSVGIGLGSPRWTLKARHARGLPERLQSVWILSVPVAQDETRGNSLIIHPHRGVPILLHHPFPVGRISRRAAVDFPATQMDEHQDVGGKCTA